MAVGFSNTNKPINPRGNDASPKAFNRAKLYSGKALSFDGVNDYVSVSYSDTLGGVWSWVSIIEADVLSGYQELFGGQYGSTNATIYLKENQLTIYTNQDNLNTAFDFETGKKYHIACSQSGDTISVYVNGQAAGSVSLTIPLNSTSGTYVIGKRPNQASEYFNGKISGTKLFNTALTAAQVADLYNNPEKVVPTGVDNTALKLFLPMQEGAGTTAYDGSGNGNHGTISGATYTHGIGAPVSQTAVIDWNKAENRFSNSENFDGSSGWIFNNVTKVSENNEDPRGTNTAVKISWAANTPSTYFYRGVDTTGSPSTIYLKVWVKSATGTNQNFRLFANNVTHFSSDFVATNEWQQFEFSYAYSGPNWGVMPSVAGDAANIYLAFPHTAADDSPYLITLTTAQPTKVLLPAGLTTGRDITGVNLFENVRKQGALNLDGNSWAEVHDNESLDFGTGSFSLEAWVKADFLAQGSGVNTILSLGGDVTNSDNSALVSYSNKFSFWIGGINVFTPVYVSESWNHIVGVRSGSSVIFYFNGAQVATGSSSSSITNSQEKQIGRDETTIRNYPNAIAQPRIYNRALTASEVLRNYNSGKNTYTND